MDADPAGKKPTRKKSRKSSTKPNSDQLQQLLKDALTEHINGHQRNTPNVCDSIAGTLEEFLDAFVVIGYDLEGTPVTIVSAKTLQSADSLSTAVTRFFMQHNQDM